MANHNFNFDGGEYLAKIGASWFVSYSFHELLDKKHINWKRVLTYSLRINTYNKTKNYHNFWLEQVLEMNEKKLNTNKIRLNAKETKNLAKLLLNNKNKY